MMRLITLVLSVSILTLLVSCRQVASPTAPSRPVIQVVEPAQPACPVRAGQWMALKGQDFGKAEDWLSGANQAVFFDGVPASRTELTQEADLATLLIVVPKGAQGGPLVIRVGEVQSEAVTVMITNAGAMLRPLLAVPVCEEVLPPPTAVDADAYLPHSGE